ncbi:MAG TPA: sugar phosphate isomerase/epimerase [Candidatus Methanoperedens sp.]|nr:sugar phosphate isomerase/epimerase [Candidatus Methanoperedens sp.]
MLGVSSVYYSKAIEDGDRLLDELAALGFDGIELEYRIRPETLRQMGRRPGREVPVLSVHAFFPSPVAPGAKGSGANAFLFSSTDREERDTAVRHGIATLEAAERLGARVVVLHLGRVPVGEGLLAAYRRLEYCGGPATPELRAAVAAVLSERERLRAPHLDAVCRSLDRLNREALCRDLLLGIENRFHPHEIPLHDETGALLREFAGGAVRYWHDVGHALNHERLGILTQEAWLEAYGAQLAGTHLHDIRGGEDHLAPGTGEADFAAILRRLPEAALKILEIRPSVPREELLAARDRLRALGY